jgi:Spy/CpxP family protein refolding chaperone
MKLEELNGRYQHLRNELDAAYAAPVWDSNRINRITEEMAPVELALASLECERSLENGGGHV